MLYEAPLKNYAANNTHVVYDAKNIISHHF